MMIMGEKKYKLISFDMFQTLVDIDTQKYPVLEALFAPNFSRGRADALWEEANSFVYAYFHRMASEAEPFVSTVDVFASCYEKLFPKYGIDKNPRDGAMLLAQAHAKALPFFEVNQVVSRINEIFTTCIISDTDNTMISGLPESFSIPTVYTSETYKAYKFSRSGILFKTALRDFGIEPCEMLHIGDGSNDVLGAKMVGADAVWVNRNDRPWDHAIKPDYVIRDLRELLSLLFLK
jgi:FMN hydrolase / 5-amino-6-(5-phospho-D-ribitylamino)uracil phosphatase